jgi:4-hydroxybenzoate polyprenyltransferase
MKNPRKQKSKLSFFLQLIRFHKQIGTILVFIPCLISIIYASEQVNYKLVLLFALGSFVMRSAGCVINDILDREFDRKVSRTQNRPLASGVIASWQAWLLFCVLLMLGFVILLQFNFLTILLGLLVVVPIMLYPLMKRFFWYPQIFLGFVFNWGVLMAWTAVTDEISVDALLLYLGFVCLTVAYDTIYGHQDAEDDLRLGLKSAAIMFKSYNKIIIEMLYVLFFVSQVYVGFQYGVGLVYFVMLNFVGIVILYRIEVLNLLRTKECSCFFKLNGKMLILLAFVICLDKYLLVI